MIKRLQFSVPASDNLHKLRAKFKYMIQGEGKRHGFHLGLLLARPYTMSSLDKEEVIRSIV